MAKVSDFRWTFKVDLGDVPAAAEALIAHLTDFRPVWPELAEVLGAHMAGNMMGRQPKLKPAYARRKRREGYQRKPLLRTGELLEAVSRGDIIDSQPMSLTVGLQGDLAVRAAALHFGTPARKSNLPARPFIEWTRDMRRDAEDHIEQHIAAGVDTFNGGGRPTVGAAGPRIGRAA